MIVTWTGRLILTLFMAVILSSCAREHTALEEILDSGVLRFALKEDLANFYTLEQSQGFEYELAKNFADYLKVDFKPIAVEFDHEITSMVKLGKAVIGAPVPVPETPDGELAYGPEYNRGKQQLIYRYGNTRPATPGDIGLKELHITPARLTLETMSELKHQYPELSWVKHTDKSTELLMRLVNMDVMRFTVADSNLFKIYRNIYPDIRVAFALSDKKPEAWVFKKQKDDSLAQAIDKYYIKLETDGKLQRLKERYFGHFNQFDYVDIKTFLNRIRTRLPLYEHIFKKVSVHYDIDWKLLAAISYQESHWDAGARSPTGVRGLMMLTLDTARYMGINNRNDPEQSIEGGAGYLMKVMKKIPSRISFPDRMWLTLAAYNVGFSHLEDARILTRKLGGDPDKWLEVRERLPLLSEKEWYEKTRYGFARGYEPVNYVENIRRYYDILNWITFMKAKQERLRQKQQQPLKALLIDSAVL